jgi:hypothetical protein
VRNNASMTRRREPCVIIIPRALCEAPIAILSDRPRHGSRAVGCQVRFPPGTSGLTHKDPHGCLDAPAS